MRYIGKEMVWEMGSKAIKINTGQMQKVCKSCLKVLILRIVEGSSAGMSHAQIRFLKDDCGCTIGNGWRVECKTRQYCSHPR